MEAPVDNNKQDAPLDRAMRQRVEQTYDEVCFLLLESEDYLTSGPNSRPTRGLAANDRLFMINQEMRITARLGAALAWLMMARAIGSGEVLDRTTALDDVDPFELADCCLDVQAHRDTRLPNRLRDLLRQSHQLYLRVVEMDGLFRARAQAVH